MRGELVRSKEIPGLVAINTAFGWTLQGLSRQKAFVDCDANLVVCALRLEMRSDDEVTSQIIHSLWQLEATDIAYSGEPP